MDTGRIRGSRAYHAVAGVGLVSYGVVHLLIAWIAAQIAVSGRGDASGQGAMRRVAEQPLGEVLLWVMAVGLAGLAGWQLLEAVVGRPRPGTARALRRRLSSTGRAVVYLVLGVLAARVAMGAGSDSDQAEQTLSARLMALPAGRVLVAALGAAVFTVGVSQLVKGLRRRFVEDLDPSTGRAVQILGTAGYAAKGIALMIIGGLFGLAAARYDPEQAGGLDAALSSVREQPFGPVLLLIIAAGIACFGVFCFVWARHAAS